MIHNVYIIDQNTGICLIHRKYGSIEFNQDLVSGFITALKDFSVEFSKGSGELKVIDMQVFYLILVFKEGVLVTAAADKNDDARVTHKALNDIIDKFLESFGNVLNDWSGDVRIFRGFSDTIDDIMKNGKVAEIPLTIPILKIYKKDFNKSQNRLAKKGIVLSEEDLKDISDKKPEWTSKRLPKQVITQGFLDKKQYEIAHKCDGFHTARDIAEEVGLPESKIQVIIDNLDKLGMLKFIEIK
ncbi:MAG: hypothetical protein BAJALOKI1v1_330009 [Promethearchaeota archaeon]|nr:MAG: hypothetical protein BAJALOKI1v1_330009 [Candidatus Lokiarchaeota archaeon]